MLGRILALAVQYRFLVIIATLGLAALGFYDFRRLPIDAVPDVTSVQVQVNTPAKTLSTPEIEKQITFPVEWALAGLPGVEQVRSISRFGFSQVTVVFHDGTDIYRARQVIAERLGAAKESLPPLADPTMGPIATGLGEIYTYALEADPGARKEDGTPYDLTDLRALQDWFVRPQLRSVPGVNEVDTIGGFKRIYQVAPDPAKLIGRRLSFTDLLEALRTNNSNGGGAYIVHHGDQLVVRTVGLARGVDDIRNIVVATEHGTPVHVWDVAGVTIDRDLRMGAATSNGKETVIGTTLMLSGENSRAVARRVDERLKQVNASLPAGVHARTLYDRTALVDETLRTVEHNLAEGALLVIVVLLVLLGNFRAAIIAALAIPLSMLIAVTGMVHLKISGNLMSLGAIDFGLIVDGAVIIVENCSRRFAEERARVGRTLTLDERLQLARDASREVRRATIFGELIIAIVYLPILTLSGIEGKMFTPMAATVLLALAAATLLSMTFIPALVAIMLSGDEKERESFVVRGAKRVYGRVLTTSLRHPWTVVGASVLVLAASSVIATRLGAEFTPKLSEGGLAIGLTRIPSTSVPSSVELNRQLEETVLREFPDEVSHVYTRVGTTEAAMDLQGPGEGECYVMLKPRSAWKRASRQEELATQFAKVLEGLPGQKFEISQPIELRVNELVAGVRGDVSIKVFGEDLVTMQAQAARIAEVVRQIRGAGDVKIDQVTGLPLVTIAIDRTAIGRLGLSVADVQHVVEIAVGGAVVSQVYEGTRRFDLVMRLPESLRRDPDSLSSLPVHLPMAKSEPESSAHTPPSWLEAPELRFVPLGSVAHISIEEGPNQIAHENGKRRVAVQANVRGRDLAGFVEEVQRRVAAEVKLPAGYWLEWGGQLENLIEARARLAVVVPIAVLLVFGLLYLSFHSVKHGLLIFSGVPLALTGGVVALWVRGIPMSITAAVGFIALSGVAVLNGLVIVSFIESTRASGATVAEAIRHGAMERLRPVLMTALVAALGFVPMALATGMGSEVQRPLATVVIGGILSSTSLTLIVLPVLYELVHRREAREEAARRTEDGAR